jgi:hypothetical protein
VCLISACVVCSGRLLDVWLVHLSGQQQVLARYYQSTAFFILAQTSPQVSEQLAELLYVVRQLSRFSFTVDYMYEWHHLQAKAAAKAERRKSSGESVCKSVTGSPPLAASPRTSLQSVTVVDLCSSRAGSSSRELSPCPHSVDVCSGSGERPRENVDSMAEQTRGATETNSIQPPESKNIGSSSVLSSTVASGCSDGLLDTSSRLRSANQQPQKRPLSESCASDTAVPSDVWSETGRLLLRQGSGLLRAVKQYAATELSRYSSSSSSTSQTLSSCSSTLSGSARSSVESSSHGAMTKLSTLPAFGGALSTQKLGEETVSEVDGDSSLHPVDKQRSEMGGQRRVSVEECFAVCNDNYRETSEDRDVALTLGGASVSENVRTVPDAVNSLRAAENAALHASPAVVKYSDKTTPLKTELNAQASLSVQNVSSSAVGAVDSTVCVPPPSNTAIVDPVLFEREPEVPETSVGVFGKVMRRLRTMTSTGLRPSPLSQQQQQQASDRQQHIPNSVSF